MPGARKTLLEMCQGAAYDAKIHTPDTIIGNPDSDAQLLLKSATRTVEDFVSRNNGHWVALVSENNFSTVTITTTGTITQGDPVIANVPPHVPIPGPGGTPSIRAGIFTYVGSLFPNNSIVTAIDPIAQTVTLSYPAVGSGTGPIVFSQSGYALPADFEAFVDGTMWDRTRFWAMRGPLTPQQWQLYKSSVIGKATLQRRWRVKLAGVPGAEGGGPVDSQQKYFFIDPTPGENGSQLVYEYHSNAPIISATDTSQLDWEADTDMCKLDGRVVELGIKYRVLDRLGQDFSTAMDEYERRADLAIARDGGAGVLDVAPVSDLGYLGWANIPETGYGP